MLKTLTIGPTHRDRSRWVGLFLLCLLACSCDSKATTESQISPTSHSPTSDDIALQDSEISILFIGNSHTQHHSLPSLVAKMIKYHDAKAKVLVKTIGVGWLEQTTTDPRAKEELTSRDWKYVVLQGQKISVSGKFDYSREAGINLAKLAQSRGAQALFYSEWGLKDVPNDGTRNEKIYQEMAKESGAKVIAIGKAWDIALAANRDLPLHEADGNHQTEMGAFLTASVIFGQITTADPMVLKDFKYRDLDEKTQKILLESASKALQLR